MSKILVEVELPNILAGCEIKVTAVSNGGNCAPIDLDSRVMVEESKVATDACKHISKFCGYEYYFCGSRCPGYK